MQLSGAMRPIIWGQLHEGDKIIIHSEVTEIKDTSMIYVQSITLNGVVVARNKSIAVFTDLEDRPISIPQKIREMLK